MHPIATTTGSDERAPSLSIKITDQEKEKYFICNQFESIESYINMLISYDSFSKKEFGYYQSQGSY